MKEQTIPMRRKLGFQILLLLLLILLLFKIGYGAQKNPSSLGSEQMGLTLAGEAGGEGYLGMYAVACVIQNRAKKSHLSTSKVIKGGFYGRTSKGARKAFSAQKKAILGLVSQVGSLKDITNGATHFENVEYFGYPSWTKSMIKTCKIGRHTFFKESR
jgi:spore germination cell wall hydrolase CwlJ-like protein